VCFYGLAKPVRTPLIDPGQRRKRQRKGPHPSQPGAARQFIQSPMKKLHAVTTVIEVGVGVALGRFLEDSLMGFKLDIWNYITFASILCPWRPAWPLCPQWFPF
jgi:hypothetical protein